LLLSSSLVVVGWWLVVVSGWWWLTDVSYFSFFSFAFFVLLCSSLFFFVLLCSSLTFQHQCDPWHHVQFHIQFNNGQQFLCGFV